MNKNLTLGDLISNFKHSAKRLELLPDYHIEGGEWEDFNNFLNGEVRPPYDELAEWNKSIENWTKQGKTIERIRLLSSPLTDYQKYEILRAYEPGTLCGQKIGVVLKKDFDKVENAAKAKDFWIFDDKYVFEMHYDSQHNYCGGELVEGTKEKQLYEKLKQISHPLEEVLKQIRLNKIDLKF